MKLKQFPETILFLNDNPLPSLYTKGVVSGKELRLRSALNHVKAIHVLAPNGEWVGDKDNIEIGKLEKKIHIHHIPTCPYYLRAFPLLLWGLNVMRTIKPDLIEAESPIISGPAGVFLSKLFKRPVVVEVRASYHELIMHKVNWIPYAIKKFILDIVYTQTLRRASGVIANSEYYRQQLDKIGVRSIKINPGIQLQSIKVTPSVRQSNTTVLGYLGRIEREKGVFLLLEAMELVLSQMKFKKNINLLIAGIGSQRKKLEALVDSNPILRKHVKFLGFQTPQQFFPKINLFVNPNIVRHPLEMVNVEAAYFGKPVICFGDDQVPETVIDGVTGKKILTMTPLALAETILNIAANSKLLVFMGKNGQTFANNYLFVSQVKRLRAYYTRLKLSDSVF